MGCAGDASGRSPRRAACPLFWTLGGNQVGKAAIAGWHEVLIPAVGRGTIAIWPFDGELDDLLAPGAVVVAETYSAEAYRQLRLELRGSKRSQSTRRAQEPRLLDWAHERDVLLTEDLRRQIASGFGDSPAGEDAFDAVAGLLGMLEVVLGHRASGEPHDDEVRDVEGSILGLQAAALTTIDSFPRPDREVPRPDSPARNAARKA